MTRRLLALVSLAFMLTACGTSSDDELRQWMSEQRSQAHPKVDPIPAPKQYKPEAYDPAGETEPFDSLKLTRALKKDATQTATNGGLLETELNRRKEPLEEFPLDTMAMVGSLTQNNKPVALLTVGKLLYQVRLGDHLGQNYGKVMKISETEVALREIVQDAAGEWIERNANLQLQERSK